MHVLDQYRRRLKQQCMFVQHRLDLRSNLFHPAPGADQVMTIHPSQRWVFINDAILDTANPLVRTELAVLAKLRILFDFAICLGMLTQGL